MRKLKPGEVISGGGPLQFEIVSWIGAGGQSFGYKAKVISKNALNGTSVFIKQYRDLKLILMGRLDNFFKEMVSRVPQEYQQRICFPLNDSPKQGIYQPAIGEAGNVIFIAYPMIEGVTLEKWFENDHHDEDSKQNIVMSLLRIMTTLNHAQIVHLDLHPGNFIICNKRNNTYVTLIDLDLARIRDKSSGIYGGIRKVGGMDYFVSPEHYDNDEKSISQKTDVFSIAVLISIILLESHPFDVGDYYQSIRSSRFILTDKGYHKNIMGVLSQGLQSEPDKRPTISQMSSVFRKYAATQFKYMRCGISISNGTYEYFFWEDKVFSGQDLRGFGIQLTSRGCFQLKIDQNNGEYGIKLLDETLPVLLGNHKLLLGKITWISNKNVLTINSTRLNMLLVQDDAK
ncbi:MAG: protein kinase [Desulfuromonadaceae bacterium]|nr:protein kinase [Desulfuromonadaceae bacterium]